MNTELIFKLKVRTNMSDYEWETEHEKELEEKIEQIYEMIEELNAVCEYGFRADFEREVKW